MILNSQFWHYCRAGGEHQARAVGPSLQKVLKLLEKLESRVLIIMKAWDKKNLWHV